MRKVFLIVAVIAVIILSVALLAAGCSNKDLNGARDILNQSQKASESIESMKVSGTVDFKTPEAEEKESRATYEAEVNVESDSAVEARIVAKDEKGEESQAYLVDEYMYEYSPTKGWTKQKVDNLEQLQSTGITNPSELAELSKYAENIEQLPDEGNNYVIAFDVGTKFFDEALGAAEQATSPEEGSEGEEIEQMLELAKETLKSLKMSMEMKIDKDTFYTTEAKINASLEDVPLFGNASLSLVSLFSDYNAPIAIELPAEAQAAKEVEGGLPTGLPGLPGLGL